MVNGEISQLFGSNINNLMIPNVSKLPNHEKVDVSNKLPSDSSKKSDFQNLLTDKISNIETDHGIKLSTHAAKRLSERNLQMDGEEYGKLKDAIGKLREKGGRNSLVVTSKAAYIVDIGNNKIVTAIDKESIEENVFTKIDSTMVLN